MNIKEVIKEITQTIFKPDLTDLLKKCLKEVTKINLPIMRDASEAFPSTYIFRARNINTFIPTFNLTVKHRPGNILGTAYVANKNIALLIPLLIDKVESNFNSANPPEVLTYKKAQYLQLIDGINFYLSYCRDFANYLLISEYSHEEVGNTLEQRVTPAELRRVELNFSTFCKLTNIFVEAPKSTISALENVPDIIAELNNVDTVTASLGQKAVDPLQMGFIAANYSPFFAFKLRNAVRDHKKYEKALAEREMLRLKLLALKQQNSEGYADTSVLKQIMVAEDRVRKLDYQIAREEEKYA